MMKNNPSNNRNSYYLIDNSTVITDSQSAILTLANTTILEKNVEPIIKENLPNPENLKRINRMRLKEKTKLMDEVIDSVQTGNITEGKKLVKCWG